MIDPGQIFCPLSPRQMQAWKLIHDQHTTEILFGGGAGGAKSFLIWILFILSCYRYPGTRYFIGRQQVTDLEEGGINTFGKILDILGISPASWNFNPNKHVLKCGFNGSSIRMGELRYRATDPKYGRLGSKEYTQAAIEECQEVDPIAVGYVISRVGRQYNDRYGIKPLLLLTANPDKGWLYDEWYDPWKRGELPKHKAFVPSRAIDNPFLPESYLRSLDRIPDLATRQRLIDGEWDYQSDPLQIIADELVTAAHRTLSTDGIARMGVDPAGDGYGIDDSCIVVVQGNTLIEIIRRRYTGISDATAEEQLAELVTETAVRYNVAPRQIRIDTQGPGAGLFAVLRSKGWDATKIYGQAQPLPRTSNPMRFANLRSQGIYELGEKLRRGEIRIVPKDPKLKADLTCYHRQETDRWWAAEDKKITRHRLGRSPDGGDATWMAFLDMRTGPGMPAARSTTKMRRGAL